MGGRDISVSAKDKREKKKKKIILKLKKNQPYSLNE